MGQRAVYRGGGEFCVWRISALGFVFLVAVSGLLWDGIDGRAVTVESAGELRAQIREQKLTHASSDSECVIEITQNVFFDGDLIRPLPLLVRNCTIRGSFPGVQLKMRELVPLFVAAENVTVRFANLTIYHQSPVSLTTIFYGIFDEGDGAKAVYDNVVVGLRGRSFDFLEADLRFNAPGGVIRVSDNMLRLAEFEFGVMSLRRLAFVRLPDTVFATWPKDVYLRANTGKEFVRALRLAENPSVASPLKVFVNGSIMIEAEDVEEDGPLVIRRKVMISGSDGGSTEILLADNITHAKLFDVQPGGALAFENLIFQYYFAEPPVAFPANVRKEMPENGLPVRYNRSAAECEFFVYNTSWTTSCAYLQGVAKFMVFEIQRYRFKRGSPKEDLSHLISLGEGTNSTLHVRRLAAGGTCFDEVNITCVVPTPAGSPPLFATKAYIEGRKRTVSLAESVHPDMDTLDLGEPEKKAGIGPVLFIFFGVTFGVLFTIVGAIVFRYVRKRRRRKHHGNCRNMHGDEDDEEAILDSGKADSLFGIITDEAPPQGSLMASDKIDLLQKITEEAHGMADEALELKEQVGSGGYGVVYKGIWHGLPVAVKTVVFQDLEVENSRHRKRAVYEAAISSSVSHRNVVQTYNYFFRKLTIGRETEDNLPGTVDWKMYIIQEFCELGSLLRAIKRSMFVNLETHAPDLLSILYLAHDIAAGMQHLHAHNIIHGDLTTRNVLLKQDKGGIIAKLSDFGLSVKLDQYQSHISGHKAGTPLYMAPELSHTGRLSKRSDVYSFGIILWELFHLSLPTAVAFARAAVSGRTSQKFSASCPAPFVLLCAVCMAPSPEDRPNFTRLASLLRRVVQLARGNDLLLNANFKDFNAEWADHMVGLTPGEALKLLDESLPEPAMDLLDTIGSPLGAGTSETRPRLSPASSIVSTPTNAPGTPEPAQFNLNLKKMDKTDCAVELCEELASESSDGIPGSVTIELSQSGDDVMTLGWMNNTMGWYSESLKDLGLKD